MAAHAAPLPLVANDTTTIVDALKSARLRATAQRIAVLRALRKTDVHPGPEAVFAAVRAELPSISLATVYKTLESLEHHGLVEEVTLRAETKRYDARTSPHHHLVCVSCRAITDIPFDGTEHAPSTIPAGFVVGTVRQQVFGVCERCATRTRARRGEVRPRSGSRARRER